MPEIDMNKLAFSIVRRAVGLPLPPNPTFVCKACQTESPCEPPYELTSPTTEGLSAVRKRMCEGCKRDRMIEFIAPRRPTKAARYNETWIAKDVTNEGYVAFTLREKNKNKKQS